MIIPIFLPHGGCPERCTFCDQRVSGGELVKYEDLIENIEKHLKSTKDQTIEVAFYGGTFTALRKEIQIQYLELIKPYIKLNRINSIRISTRPDAIDRQWINELKLKYNVKTIELGVQSFNESILKVLGRSYSNEHVYEAVRIIHELNLDCGLHFMIGCPDETEEDHQKIINETLRLKPKYVRIHPLLVIKGTELSKQYLNGIFKPIDIDRAVDICALIVENLEKSQVQVIRIGLQPNEILEDEILAGPYEPALGEKVRRKIIFNKLFRNVNYVQKDIPIQIEIHENNASLICGHKKEFICWMQDKYKLTLKPEIKVSQNKYEGKIRFHHIARSSECREIELF